MFSRAAGITVTIAIATYPEAAASADKTEQAEVLIKKGNDLRRASKDLEAFGYFRQAYEIAPSPRTTAQLGLVEQALGRWTDAESHLEAALASASDPWITKVRSILRDSLTTVKKGIGHIDLAGEPAGAIVTINGRPAGSLPLSAPIRHNQGDAEIELAATGHLTARRTLKVKGGQTHRLAITLDRIPEPPAAPRALPAPRLPPVAQPVVPPIHDTPTPAPARDPGRALRTAGLVAGAASVPAAAFGLWMSLRVRSLQREHDDEKDSRKQNDLASQARGAQTLQWVGYGTAAAALTAGAALYYVGHTRRARAAVSLVPLPGGAAIAFEYALPRCKGNYGRQQND